MGRRWPCSCCFVGCCFQDLFNIACNILVQFLLSFFSIHLVSIHVVYPYSRIVITTAWKKIAFYFTRQVWLPYDSLLIAVHTFDSQILMSFSIDEALLSRWTCPLISEKFSVEMSPFWLKHIYFILSAFTWRSMPPAACSRLCSRDSGWIGVFARSTMSFA